MERLRTLGVDAADRELQNHPHLLDLARLGCEAFRRTYADPDAFDGMHYDVIDDCEEDGRTPAEVFDGIGELLSFLRARVS